MPTDPICNICKSKLKPIGTQPADLESWCADPIWLNDPIFTQHSLAGVGYSGKTNSKKIHIDQLIVYWNSVCTLLLVPFPPSLTQFLTTKQKSITKADIVSLRLIVEQCLEKVGVTIADYFKGDKYGEVEYETTQVDWTDVDRIEKVPYLPERCSIKAVHIEELRRGMLLNVLWEETWEQGPVTDPPLPLEPMIHDSGSYTYPFVPGGGYGGGGHFWPGGRLYALNNWYREGECWYGNGAGVMTGGSCSYSFDQDWINEEKKQAKISVVASSSISATISLGSMNYVMSVFKHLVQLSDTLLIEEANNHMKIKLEDTSVSGSNYYGILELDATISFKDGSVKFPTLVLANIAGTQCHAEGESWAYVDDEGYLCWDPADGGMLWYRLQHWQPLASGVFSLASIAALEYGYNKNNISNIRIWGVRLHSSCSGYDVRNCAIAPICVLGDTVSGSGNINLQLGHIKLIS
jgi:hypothetical protein